MQALSDSTASNAKARAPLRAQFPEAFKVFSNAAECRCGHNARPLAAR